MRATLIALAIFTMTAAQARSADDVAAAKDLTRIPQPLIDAHPELAALEPALQRYGTANLDEVAPLEPKFFGGLKCTAQAGQDAAWSRPELGIAYVGEHQKCHPQGWGRVRTPKGVEWVGAVAPFDQDLLPMPAGVGVFIHADGSRYFWRFHYTPTAPVKGFMAVGDGERVLLGFADANDGTFGVPLQGLPGQRDERVIKQGEAFYSATDAAKFFDRWTQPTGSWRWRIYRPDGKVLESGYAPRSASFYLPYGDERLTVLEVAEHGLRVEGSNYNRHEPDAEEARAGRWARWVFVTLSKSFNGYPPGRYFRRIGDDEKIALHSFWKLFNQKLLPRDAATVAAHGPSSTDCKWKVPKGELLPGWVVWKPACFTDGVWAFSPDGAYLMGFIFGADGKITRRFVEQDYGMAGALVRRNWTAPRFELRGGVPQPVGRTVYQAYWGDEVALAPGRTARAPAGADGYVFAHYEGPMKGLVPHGAGQCRSSYTSGAMEACEYRDGRRIDAAYAQRSQRHEQQLAEQSAQRQRAERAEAARRRAEQEEADRLAQAEARQQEEQRRLREQEDAEDEAAWAAHNAREDARRQAENQKFAQDMQANQKQYNDAVAAARAQQEQERRNREEAERVARERREGERAYAEGQARNAKDKAEAEAAYQRQRQIDQARARTGASGSASSAPSGSGGSASASGAPVPSECIVETERKWGGHCSTNPERSLTVRYKNACDSPITIRICIETDSGQRCQNHPADPGEVASQWECNATGAVTTRGTTRN